MNAITENLKEQIQTIKNQVRQTQSELDKATADLQTQEQECDAIDSRIKAVDDIENKGRITNITRHERTELNLKKSKAESFRTNARQLHDRLKSKQSRYEAELERLENLIHSEKQTNEHKTKLAECLAVMNEKEKVYVELQAREEQEIELLEELRQKHSSSMREALLKEVETGKKLPATVNQNRKGLEDIGLQETRVDTIKSALLEAAQNYETSKEEYQEAKHTYCHFRMLLAELRYKEAVAKFMPTIAEYSAAQRAASCGGYDIKVALNIDEQAVEAASQSLREEIAV